MQIFKDIAELFIAFSTTIPLQPFVLFGSFIEEVIAPIPSPLVLTLSGSIAKAQEHALITICLLAILGAIGKTGGAWVLYAVALKTKNIVTSKYGKILFLTQEDTEYLGKKFGTGWKNYLLLFVARATPIIPSAPLSISCGIIKLSIVTYLIATFAGSIIRNLLFLYFGYTGISNYQSILGGLESTESFIQIGIFTLLLIIIGWFYYKRRSFKKLKKVTV